MVIDITLQLGLVPKKGIPKIRKSLIDMWNTVYFGGLLEALFGEATKVEF